MERSSAERQGNNQGLGKDQGSGDQGLGIMDFRWVEHVREIRDAGLFGNISKLLGYWQDHEE